MSTSLYLMYLNPKDQDTRKPIEEQWFSSNATCDGGIGIHVFSYVFYDVKIEGPEGSVGEWIGVSTQNIQQMLIDGLRDVVDAIGEVHEVKPDWHTVTQLTQLGRLLIEALEMHLAGKIITIRWS